MTKKHYEMLAETIARFNKRYPYWNALIKELVNDLADAMQEDNDKFDKERFLAACKFPD